MSYFPVDFSKRHKIACFVLPSLRPHFSTRSPDLLGLGRDKKGIYKEMLLVRFTSIPIVQKPNRNISIK